MAICDRRHANMSKQATPLADIDVTPPLGLAYGHVIWFVSRVIRVLLEEQNIFLNLKPFDMKDLFCGDSDYVKMSCTGRETGLVVLALRC